MPQNMSESTLPIQKPYVGPRSFEEEDSNYFYGREQEADALLCLVITNALVLFYARSGTGKSSLINARLIPSLRKEGFYCEFPVSQVGGNPPTGRDRIRNVFMFNMLQRLDKHFGVNIDLETCTLADYLQAHQTKIATTELDSQNLNKVIIIDQFEEIITQHDGYWKHRSIFFQQINDALTQDPALWVVLSMREDYIAKLDPYARFMTDRLSARFYMQRMTAENAREAIERPAEEAQRPFALGVSDQLINKLRRIRIDDESTYIQGEFIEPVQLQVVCYQLWQGLQDRTPAPITSQDLADVDVDQALGKFYDDTLNQVTVKTAVSESTLRTWFEQDLITPDGKRGRVHQGAAHTAGIPNQIVRALADKYLLHAEFRAEDTWYTLIHDGFIPPILRANAAWLATQTPLIQAANAWSKNPAQTPFYQGKQLKDALKQEPTDTIVKAFLEASNTEQKKAGLKIKEIEAKEQKTHVAAQEKAAQKIRRISIALSILVVIILVAAVFSLLNRNQAREAADAAVAASGLANVEAEAAAIARSEVIAQQNIAQEAHLQTEEQRILAEAGEQRANEQKTAAEISNDLAQEALSAANSDRLQAQVEAASAQEALTQAEAFRQQQTVPFCFSLKPMC